MGGASPRSVGLRRSASSTVTLSSVSGAGVLEAEVRQHMSLSGQHVTRQGLQVYVEGLRLMWVTAGMVTQVVLALLNLDLGDSPCEVSRFVGMLQSPPPWEELDFATALWGAVGEPAVAVVQYHRKARNGGLTSPLVENPQQRVGSRGPHASSGRSRKGDGK